MVENVWMSGGDYILLASLSLLNNLSMINKTFEEKEINDQRSDERHERQGDPDNL
jgi:hypothetical protein